MDFFNTFRIQLILLFFTSISFGQIETGKVKPPAEKAEKPKEKEKPAKAPKIANYQPENMIYFSGTLGLASRTLKTNSNYFGKPLGERVNEKPLFTGGFTVGMRTKLVKKLYLDFGLSMANYGEKYNFKASDSAFQYTSKYSNFAVPIKLQFITGTKVKLIAGIGLQPQLFLGYKQEIEWTTSENVKGSRTEKKGDFNFFTIAAIANLGVEWQFAKNVSLHVLPEVRTQLNSTYGKQAPYNHKGHYFGAQFGFTFGFN